jgi:small subunit ribosomal protein S20
MVVQAALPDLRKERDFFIIAPFSEQPIFPKKSGVYMANTASAKKAARQAVKRRASNMAQRSALRTAMKDVRKAIAAGDKAAARTVFQKSASTIDSIADKNIMHKNTAARHKSRLSAAVKAMA